MVDMEFHATACSDEIMTVLPADGSCVQIDHPVEAVHGEDTSLVIDASCPPSPGQPIGEAVGEAPVTVCCSG